jgi:hypothetical protein
MAATAGRSGLVTIGSATVGGMNDATLDVDVENAEITAFGDTAVTRSTGLVDSSYAFSGNHDMSDTQQATLRAAVLAGSDLTNMRLRTGTASGYYQVASMVPSKMSIKASAGPEPVEINVTLAGDGAVTYATGAATVD